ncbi:hypothetical protein MPNT_80047 [Candidatus Methylacidithermus pantelleriae]|uniref:Uncharacterized protein n=1 Tax=Candidatus Methylacidithermus pantelleriae TaxID=2744239 RepID=A0A8J2BRL3_9BACT|nr:hypothetical protein MPNT_80047 [Candidatus Methylacidithermus pantelleriae]
MLRYTKNFRTSETFKNFCKPITNQTKGFFLSSDQLRLSEGIPGKRESLTSYFAPKGRSSRARKISPRHTFRQDSSITNSLSAPV